MTSDQPWKMIYLARRNPALAAEEFEQAWREHSALGRQCSNVQDKVIGVTQCCRLLEEMPTNTSADYDGVNLLRLRDLQAANDIWTDAETLAIMRPDERRVFDRYVQEFTLVARERVVMEGVSGDAVLVAFLKLTSKVTQSNFEEALIENGPNWPSLRKTVLNLTEPTRPQGYDFDVIIEWWFDDANALKSALATCPPMQAIPAQMQAFFDLGASVLMATRVTHRRP